MTDSSRWSAPLVEVAGGASRAVFMVLVLAATMIGLVAVVGSLDDEMRGPALVIAGIPAVLLGAAAFWVRHRALARRISVHAEGVREQNGARVVALRFDEIEALAIRTWHFSGAHVGGLGLVGALAAGAASGALRAAARPTTPLSYDAMQVNVTIAGGGRTIVLRKWDPAWSAAYAEIRARVEPRLLVTARAQVTHGAGAGFGPVKLSPHAIAVGTRKIVPLAEIERVNVDRFRVAFVARGKRMPAATVPLARVPNLHVMLDLIGEQSGGRIMRPAA